MKIPASFFTLSLIAAATLALTACGGGSENGNDDGNSVAMTTVTPVVMDGLISKALVCWDANDNGACDATETQALTDSTGQASLFIPSANVANAKLIAEITAGVSSDADTGLVSTGYTLRAPAGKHSVISPLTDMTQAKLVADATLTFASAEAAVLADLGLSGVSVTDNFIANRATNSNAQNASLKAHTLVLVQQTADQNATPLDCTTVASQPNPDMSPVLQSINTALNDTTLQSVCASGITASCETALKAKAAAIVTSCTTPVTPVPPVVQPAASTVVTRKAQTISFIAPVTQKMGVAPPALKATATSKLAVTFTSNTATICTVSATKITLRKAGSCSISARQAGNTLYTPAPVVTRIFKVLAAPVPVPVTSAANGKLVYSANTCAACHGMPPSWNKIANGANNPTRILNAINNGTGGMNMYIGRFTTQQLNDMAAYLATPGI
jgi:hypothetical protein